MKTSIERTRGGTRQGSAVFLALLIMLASATDVAAQYNLGASDRPQVRIDLTRPVFTSAEFMDVRHGLVNGTINVGLTLPIGRDVSLQLNMPIVRWSSSYPSDPFGDGGRYARNGISYGNPYIGLIGKSPGRATTVRLGVYPGFRGASLEGSDLGWLAEMPMRAESFYPKTTTGKVSLDIEPDVGVVRPVVISGASILVPHFAASDPVEVTLSYGAGAAYRHDRASIRVLMLGWMWATQTGASILGQSAHFLSLSGGMSFGRITPSIEIRLPLEDEIRRDMHATVGAGLTYVFGPTR